MKNQIYLSELDQQIHFQQRVVVISYALGILTMAALSLLSAYTQGYFH